MTNNVCTLPVATLPVVSVATYIYKLTKLEIKLLNILAVRTTCNDIRTHRGK